LGRGGFRGGLRGFRGGYAQAGGGRDFSNQELYADYNGPEQQGAAYGSGGGGGSTYSGSGNYNPSSFPEGEPSQQIMVRNVSSLALLREFHLLTVGISAALVDRQ
jgi:hypothetical protein